MLCHSTPWSVVRPLERGEGTPTEGGTELKPLGNVPCECVNYGAKGVVKSGFYKDHPDRSRWRKAVAEASRVAVDERKINGFQRCTPFSDRLNIYSTNVKKK